MLRISAYQIEKSYSTVKAVNGISFDVQSGQIFALLGPNGAGKSSLIRMLVGLTRPDSGQIRIEYKGEELSTLPQRCYGYLPEDRGLYQDRTVRQNLTYIGKLRGMTTAEINTALVHWCTRLDLLEKMDDNLTKLSKGNQQKVQLISCVMHTPDLLILDEPFSGLDPINQEHVLSILTELKQSGTTVILSAHQMALIERLADQMLLLNKGQLVAQGSLAQVSRQLDPQQWFEVCFEQQLPAEALDHLAAVAEAKAIDGCKFQLTLKPDVSVSQLLQQLSTVAELADFSRIQPALHQLYLTAVQQHNQQQPLSQPKDAEGVAA
ncbi:MAG: ATP-binding cassette domain-containing protein [Gammaproteobacteria bacterium]|nr:ATP-binding cassette domain-containing protein [Gammaproteobacteria bacterium]MBU2058641.1 ATP-binding cassette domain-containing protein [Gammaproteobacteria bacterium]MBU2173593.1 ATP-binding cassette domain-containing protein [Gammaproteobacteria bacterium]MBU2246547.1 ATP-binding cassette domain-containing protein [Gammaproteobacteria bacterium]MBU2343220.1 ATP-binding cassette domain-containing protein [Gammaproteobacteria bacterium]